MSRRLPDLQADVLVIGSGAGGAPTAALLAEAGHDVLVLEEGPLVRQGETVPFSLDQMDRQYRAGGVTAAFGSAAIAYTEGCCAGGGTEINSGLYRRPPENVLDRWRQTVDDLDPADVYATCDEVEKELSVQPVPGAHLAASEALRRGAERLGWRHDESPRWMDYSAGPDARNGRRRSMSETYLPRAESAGARLLTDHRVDGLVIDGGRARRADVTTDEGRRTVHFRDVFVCGGAIQTPALLQRSGLRGAIGRSLAVHPTVKLAARFPESLNVADDVPVHQVKEFAPDLSFGGSASSPGLVALALSDSWDRFAPAVRDWRHFAVYYAAITSEGRGSVRRCTYAARSARDVPPHEARPCAPRPGSGPPRVAPARSRSDRRLPLVPRRPGRAPPGRSRHDAGDVQHPAGQLDDRAPVLDRAAGPPRRDARRQLRSRGRHTQRAGQRRVAAARRAGCQSAGLGDGHCRPQRPPLPGHRDAVTTPPERVAAPDTTIITGTTGWLGRALLHHLTGDGPMGRGGVIRAMVTDAADVDELRRLGGVEPVVGDVRRPDGLTALFDDLSGTVDVIHAVGVIHPRRVDDFEEVNARGTANVLDAARAAGVRRLVYVSSNSPFGANSHRLDVFRDDEPYHPLGGYGRSKMRAELHVADAVAAGLDAVIVRPPWFYGPFQPERQTAFLRMVRRGRFPVVGDGRQRRSMVYVDNLVQGILAAELTCTPPGRAWWIADAEPYALAEIVVTVGRALAAEGLDVTAQPGTPPRRYGPAGGVRR